MCSATSKEYRPLSGLDASPSKWSIGEFDVEIIHADVECFYTADYSLKGMIRARVRHWELKY